MKPCIALLAALVVIACGTSTSNTDGGPTGTLYTIGGYLPFGGANDTGLVLATPGQPNLDVSGNTFVFANGVPSGTAYDVTIVHQATCTGCTCALIDGGVGVVGTANVGNILVGCAVALP